jgi:hypothetical protein
MNILPLIAMIFASLYQGVSQTSTAFALAALIAITFAAGLFQEFRVHHVMFASDPVSAVITRPKITKEQQQQLFYSSDDYETFEFLPFYPSPPGTETGVGKGHCFGCRSFS